MTETAEIEIPPQSHLTEKQRSIYDWIVGHCEVHGYSPTVREIGKAFGFKSTNAVVGHLKPLMRKGWITWHKNRSRTIRPIGGLR